MALAEVTLAQSGKTTRTDEAGRFRFDSLPQGPVEFVVRAIGYESYTGRTTIVSGAAGDVRIQLRRAKVLDTVSVTASAVLPSFEDNRAIGLGRFITRAQLDSQINRRLSEVIAQLPGVKIRQGMGGRAWLFSSRRSMTSIQPRGTGKDSIDIGDARSGAAPGLCYAQVYIDGHAVYRSAAGEPLFDLNSISVDQIEAIEYYAGPAQTPGRYSNLNSNCGVIVIHRRRSG